jgi:hypothetical protein
MLDDNRTHDDDRSIAVASNFVRIDSTYRHATTPQIALSRTPAQFERFGLVESGSRKSYINY